MFDVYCPECRGRKLIFPEQVTRIDNDEAGILVSFTCWCGAPGAWRTGASARDESVSWAAPALAG